jgi:hypothetical protein
MSKKLVAALGLISASLFASETASAQQAGDIFVRARAIYVSPDASATTSINGTADIDNKVVPEVDFRDRSQWVEAGEVLLVPKGVEHRPCAEEECKLLVIEKADTDHTGGENDQRRKENHDHI